MGMSASNQTAAEQRLQEYLSRLAAVLGESAADKVCH